MTLYDILYTNMSYEMNWKACILHEIIIWKKKEKKLVFSELFNSVKMYGAQLNKNETKAFSSIKQTLRSLINGWSDYELYASSFGFNQEV